MNRINTYKLQLCGLCRELPILPVSDSLAIASFVILGDTQLIEAAAEELVKRVAHQLDSREMQIDYLVCPEAKAVPLAHAMARLMGLDYIVVRKSVKAYMQDPRMVSSSAITTAGKQRLVLDGRDADALAERNVIIVDDVISTGGSLQAMEQLLAPLNCSIAAKVAILLEEGGYRGDELIYLERLPVFHS